MKRIALGLSIALLIMTNSGNAQSVNTLKTSPQKMPTRFLKQAPTINFKNLKEKDTKVNSSKTAEGGVHSGGGTLIKTNQGIGLLDLYLYNNEAFSSKTKGQTLKVTKAYQDFGFEFLTDNNTEILNKTLRQIEKWAPSSPVMARFITTQIKEIPIYYTSYQLGFKDQSAFIPTGANLPNVELSLAAYYIENLGVFIQKPVFDSLSEKNQMALLIHEGLRHAQITWGYQLSNEQLQKLTAEVLREPSTKMTLDKPPYMQKELAQAAIEFSKEVSTIRDIDALICKLSAQFCNLGELSMSSHEEIYLQAISYLWPKLRTERDGTRYRDLYATYEQLTIGQGSLQNLKLMLIASEAAPSVRSITLGVRTRFSYDSLSSLIAEYNMNAGRFSESSIKIRKFISFMRDSGYFK